MPTRPFASKVEAIVHLCDCHAATAEHVALRKSSPKSELRRQASLMQTCLDVMRVHCVLDDSHVSISTNRTVADVKDRCEQACKNCRERLNEEQKVLG